MSGEAWLITDAHLSFFPLHCFLKNLNAAVVYIEDILQSVLVPVPFIRNEGTKGRHITFLV